MSPTTALIRINKLLYKRSLCYYTLDCPFPWQQRMDTPILKYGLKRYLLWFLRRFVIYLIPHILACYIWFIKIWFWKHGNIFTNRTSHNFYSNMNLPLISAIQWVWTPLGILLCFVRGGQRLHNHILHDYFTITDQIIASFSILATVENIGKRLRQELVS